MKKPLENVTNAASGEASMSPHTAEKWVAGKPESCGGLSQIEIHSESGELIATVNCSHGTRLRDGEPNQKGPANARLICAAPDLLDALGDADLMLNSLLCGDAAFVDLPRAHKAIKAALAKARGQS